MFLAKLKPQEVREPDGTVRYMVDENAAKQLGSYVNPPFETYPTEPRRPPLRQCAGSARRAETEVRRQPAPT